MFKKYVDATLYCFNVVSPFVLLSELLKQAVQLAVLFVQTLFKQIVNNDKY